MPLTVTTTVIFCYNGINNSEEEAQAFADGIQQLAETPCQLRYNHATSPRVIRRSLTEIAATVTGVGVLGLMTGGVGPAVAAATSVGALTTRRSIQNIQHVKTKLATTEAEEIVKTLNSDPRVHMVLVGHSQGAYLLGKILETIKEHNPSEFDLLRGRISVITIGGLDIVHCTQAARVVNFFNKDDHVANYGAPAYTSLALPVRPRCHPACYEVTTDGGGHSAAAYFKSRKFSQFLKKYTSSAPVKFLQHLIKEEIETWQQIREDEVEKQPFRDTDYQTLSDFCGKEKTHLIAVNRSSGEIVLLSRSQLSWWLFVIWYLFNCGILAKYDIKLNKVTNYLMQHNFTLINKQTYMDNLDLDDSQTKELNLIHQAFQTVRYLANKKKPI